MPENTLYWWGYADDNLEEASVANGWTPASAHSFVSPTFNTNAIALVSTTNTMVCVGTKNNITTGDIQGIAQGVNVNGVYGYFTVRSNKNMQGTSSLFQATGIDSTSQKKYQVAYTSQSTTFFIQAYDGHACNISAIWYE